MTDTDTVDVSYITASFDAENLDFWSTDAPNLYDVYVILKDKDGNVIDTQKKTTGFRKVTYSIEDGFRINDKPVWLTGYAQRSTNEWAAIGMANDWLKDYDMQLLKEANSNFIRWMHTAPHPGDVRSTDKYGVAIVAPAGDKEKYLGGRQWSQRVEAMRSTMIYFRNSPSIMFWETGNNAIPAANQQEMTDLKAKLDPYGGRFCGCRTIQEKDQIQAAEYVGTMLNRHASPAKNSMTALNKFMPIVETEYHREESARRVWDDFSPPDYDLDNDYYKTAAMQGKNFHDFTSEDFAINDAESYQEFYKDRVNGPSGNNYYTAAAALCWTDSNQHARTTASENGRMSGRVDPVRIPKESYYTYQVMQQTDPTDADEQIHIIGHFSYEPLNDLPQGNGGNYYYEVKEEKDGVITKTGKYERRDPTKKTVYVAASQFVSSVELYIDENKVGECKTPINTFIFPIENVDVTSGDKMYAVAYDAQGQEMGRHEINRAGAEATIKLEAHTGTEGFIADGSDLMYFDVKVVDAEGNVCPLAYDKISFEVSGDAKFMGGYNSGYAKNKTYGKWGVGETVIGKDYVYAECGINRVFLKAGRKAGKVTVTATMEGGKIPPVTATIDCIEYPEEIKGGLTKHTQQTLQYGKIQEGGGSDENLAPMTPLAQLVKVAKANWLTSSYVYVAVKGDIKDYYTVKINNTDVAVTNKSYKPDAATGVVCDIEPVLIKLKELGADFTYEKTADSIIVKSKKNQNGTIDATQHEYVLKKGETAIGYDGDPQGILTNAQIEQENSQLMMEIGALMSYIDGVTTSTDEKLKVMNITYSK